MNQGTFSDYHWVHPDAVGVGHLIAGCRYDGYYGSGRWYVPTAGIYQCEIYTASADRMLCSRLSKN